jgi:TonB-dependent SusC/RagA subfamily outer membrane receptor
MCASRCAPIGWLVAVRSSVRLRLSLLAVIMCVLAPAPTRAQAGDSAGSVAGRVVEALTNAPISDVQVFIEGTTVGTVTDAEGRFRITGITSPRVTLAFRKLGFAPQTREVNAGDLSLAVSLREMAALMDQVVVTGTPGATQTRAIGNVVATVDMQNTLDVSAPSSIQSLLSTQVAGLEVARAGGAVGVGGNTRIRGVGSVTLTGRPLIYVDGVRVDDTEATTSPAFNRGDAPSRINDFSPEDIERIEVIKGPAAATLYGTEAANGVIQIITKRGRGEPSFSLKVEQGANFLGSPEKVFPAIWGVMPGTSDTIQYNLVAEEQKAGRSPFSTGHPQGYALNMQGSGESVRYFLSGAFDRDEGIVDYNWQNKLSGRANVGYFKNAWDVNASLGTIRSTTRSPNVMQPFTTQIIWGTLAGVGDPKLHGWRRNPPEDYESLEGYEVMQRTTASVQIKHSPLSWLTHRFTTGFDVGDMEGSALIPRDPAGSSGPWGGSSQGSKSVNFERKIAVTADYAATATADVGSDLQFATSVGAQYAYNRFDEISASGTVFPAPGVETVSSGATRGGGEGFAIDKVMGLYAQEQIGWKNRRFLTIGVRGDDHSAFGSDYDFVVYPKVSASWVISEEPFMGSLGPVDNLRLRAAWGRAGQQPNTFAAMRLLTPTVGPGGSSTLTLGNLGNPDLAPEVGNEIELGFDASLFSQRLDLQFTYYDQTTRDAIVALPVLPSSGYPGSQLQNAGIVTNSGVELNTKLRVIDGDRFGWDVGAILSTNRNRLVDDGGVAPSGTRQLNVEGYPLFGIFAKKVVHAEFAPDGSLTNVLCEGGDPIAGGGPAVPCDQAGTAYWGPVTPTWEGSVNTTLRFGRLSLFGLLNFTGGHYRVDGDLFYAHTFYKNTEAAVKRTDPILAAYMEEGITGEGPGIIKAGFARLRTVSASYELPDAWAHRARASRARIMVSGDNVATPWLAQEGTFGRRQVDPEVRPNTSETGAYNQERWPITTRITASLRLTF